MKPEPREKQAPQVNKVNRASPEKLEREGKTAFQALLGRRVAPVHLVHRAKKEQKAHPGPLVARCRAEKPRPDFGVVQWEATREAHW